MDWDNEEIWDESVVNKILSEESTSACGNTSNCDSVKKVQENKKTSKHVKKKKISNAVIRAQKIVKFYQRCKKPVQNTKKEEQKRTKTKQESSDSEYSSSDNIPLKYFKDNKSATTRRKKEQTYRQLFEGDCEDEVEYDSEDSYKPSKKDQNSSDSEFSPEESNAESDVSMQEEDQPKRHKHEGKRKSKTNKTFAKNPGTAVTNNVEKAKERSLQESKLNTLIANHHKSRLDRLLEANGMLRETITSDGNCFFNAALFHLPSIEGVSELRHLLCDHMIDNAGEYTGFFSSPATLDSAEQELLWMDFSIEVDQLRRDGIWSNKAADMLPLALANFTGRHVRIFSSSSEASVLDIEPTMQRSQNTNHIYLAYVGSRGISEHYDGCVKKTDRIQQAPMQTSEKNATVTETTANADENNEGLDTPLEQSPLKTKTQRKGRPKGTPKKKSASFMTPPKKKLFRKRKATPETWKKNVRKQLKLTGQQYVSQRGKTVKARVMKSVNCSKCKLKCSTKVTEEKRNEIFKNFWSLGSYERQKDFVVSHIEEKKTRTYLADDNQPVKKRRQVHRTYHFETDGSRTIICKKFFLATLSVGESYIDHAMKNKSGGVFAGSDKRGRHRPYNKTTERAAQLVREHIESFPALEGHYTRKDSNRKYLGQDLNITKMYELYLQLHKGNLREDELVSQPIYRRIFNEEYNFSFHIPKKDQCSLCVNYHKSVSSNTTTEKEKENFEKHQERKKRAREEKQKDKTTAKSRNDTFAATFDLQAVLHTPCSLVSQLYYTRKLSCYNLSIYNLGSSNATCYLWSEVEAKRGSCEIGTCLYLQLLSLPSSIKHAILYSDACSGQNRNQFTATSLMHAVSFLPNLEIIDHKFLESGHTQMECDSMHSAIEFAKKKTEIYIPQQWSTVIRMARRKDPYNVVPLTHEDIWDFKKVQSQSMKYSKVEYNGTKINWLNIKWLRFMKEDSENILFKYDFEEEFRKMKVTGSGKRGRPEKSKNLPRKYNGKQPVSQAKKKDLLNLCKSKVISPEYHDYYKNLPCSNNVVDRLPEPDADEDDTDSETE
ncbi:uncharacterized protein LOC134239069 [Saccostrea cucullata]|uniref:uncharacterized protein LOC134239069 n=1 Tax=Saccostrea cuccullata TaxID=36930 RepID=UPI002ED60A9B